jgi:hypothetical protein
MENRLRYYNADVSSSNKVKTKCATALFGGGHIDVVYGKTTRGLGWGEINSNGVFHISRSIT